MVFCPVEVVSYWKCVAIGAFKIKKARKNAVSTWVVK